MRKKISCPFCGRTKSRHGNKFTKETLEVHKKACNEKHIEDTMPMELTDLIADDMPDGAYFAMAHELGEL